MRILANDGISQKGIAIFEKAGFEVITTTVAQPQLENFINEYSIDVLLVGNTTQVRQELLEACPSIKLIGKAGTELDTIDEDFARDHGIHIVTTSDATANAIAELVFAHLFGMVRFLHQSNRNMPLEGDTHFKALKKEYSNGIELRGKTLGIIGDDASADAVAKLALGVGMKVIFTGDYSEEKTINLTFFNGQTIDISLDTQPFKEVLKNADFISLHLPAQDSYVMGIKELEMMRNGSGIVNVCSSGAIDEVALVNAIEGGKIKYAALDVFENQPTPEIQLLMNPEISFTPNIGSLTSESKQRVDEELATLVIEALTL